MEFISCLTSDKYRYENMNLLELRKKIFEQENLTYLDILKGYVAKREIELTYQPVEVLSNEMEEKINVIINDILEDFFKQQTEMYIKKQDQYKQFEDEYSTFEISKEISLVEYIKRKNEYFKKEPNVDFRNKVHKYALSISSGAFMFFSHNSNELIKLINERVTSEIGEEYCFASYYGKETNIDKLPKKIDLSQLDDYDFENKASIIKNYNINVEKPLVDERILFSFAPKYMHANLEIYFMKKLTKEEAKEQMYKAIEQVLSKEIVVNPMVYAQQLEAMPITINIDSKTNKIYLIDGYKRLLYVNNEELLNREVAVKVFYDLSSQSNLDLLYAANYWKKTLENRQIDFHDRGFLFNLKQTYDISENMFNNENYTLLQCLSFYDYTNVATYSSSTSTAQQKAQKKGFSSPNACMVSDIKQMANLLDFERKYEYLPIVETWLLNNFITILGYLRKDRNYKTQKEINLKAVLEEIFNDKKMQKVLAKKTGLSTNTYAIKYFAEKKIDEWMEEIIKKHIY